MELNVRARKELKKKGNSDSGIVKERRRRVSVISSRRVAATVGGAMIDGVEKAKARVKVLFAIVGGSGKRMAPKKEDMCGQKALGCYGSARACDTTRPVWLARLEILPKNWA
ncbi:Hypothetical predicted protein [Olea europaea subsp. europaea]|uniref:Uncharacterized protein n=1 Tax=Olea europaea subsp. europaea TaxID=158383 RepID=A0A8S0PMR0_OLEEU|nr:Hypothetical predicted protein [Olea europaea subsp. europaea]